MEMGLYSEQGGESIHAEFNAIKRSYTSMPCPEARIRAMIKEHYLWINPESRVLKPHVKKRKFSNLNSL